MTHEPETEWSLISGNKWMTDDMMNTTNIDNEIDFFGRTPSDTPHVDEERKRRRQRVYARPTPAELRMLFDPLRTYLNDEDEREAKTERALLERAGLKSNLIAVPNGSWSPRRHKRKRTTHEAPVGIPQETLDWFGGESSD